MCLGGIPSKIPEPEDLMPHHFITFMHGVFTKLIPEHGINVEFNLYLPQHMFVNNDTHVYRCETDMKLLLQKLKDLDIVSEKSCIPKLNRSVDVNFKKQEPDWTYSPNVSEYFFKF